jgi:hypothetical protein
MLKRYLAKLFSLIVVKKIESTYKKAPALQSKILKQLINKAKHTEFGKDHNFSNIFSYQDYCKKVPVRNYEQLYSYIEKVKKGNENILWPGKPRYFAKTSGTTSGAKLIPITKESMPNHINSARNALLFYINKTGKTNFLNGKMIFIQGSPVLEDIKGIKTGRLSGIVAHYVPSYLRRNNMPSLETNSIENWEDKILKICEETSKEEMTVIGGIPSWVLMYFEKLLSLNKKQNISQLFEKFSLYIYGGVNYSPYEKIFYKLIGKKIDSIEYFPASEGFFAYQNDQKDKSLLLQYDSGIYFEFIKVEDFEKNNPERFNLSSIELYINYVLIVSTNAGLWAYNTGDTVMFTSIAPPKLLVTGRHKHFISAFGEHVIASEVELSLSEAAKKFNVSISEFTVAPKIENGNKLPCHEWFIEFEQNEVKLKEFEKYLDVKMQEKNLYYEDLIKGKVLKPLEIRALKKGSFNLYMKSIGKLGEQNKIPRLQNDRKFVSGLINNPNI